MPTLIQIGGENITVSSSVIGPTSSEVTDEVIMAEFYHKSGGDIHVNTVTDPTAAGVTGDIRQRSGNRWRVWGHDEVQSFLMIREGSGDGIVAVQYYGTGKT